MKRILKNRKFLFAMSLLFDFMICVAFCVVLSFILNNIGK